MLIDYKCANLTLKCFYLVLGCIILWFKQKMNWYFYHCMCRFFLTKGFNTEFFSYNRYSKAKYVSVMLVTMGIAMCTIASANQEVEHVHDDKVGYTTS